MKSMFRRLGLAGFVLLVLMLLTAYGLSTNSADAIPVGKYGVNAKNAGMIMATRVDADQFKPGRQVVVPGAKPVRSSGSDYSRFMRTRVMKSLITVGGIHMMAAGAPGDSMCEGCQGSGWPSAGSPCWSPNSWHHCWLNGQSYICYCACMYEDKTGTPYGCRLNPAYPCW